MRSHASGFDGDLDTVFSRSAMVSGTAMLIGTVAGGLLGQLDLSLPFVARSGLLALAFVVALLDDARPGFRRTPLDARDTASGALDRGRRRAFDYGWSQRSLRLLMLASAVQTGFIIWGFYAWQPYFLELLQTDAIWFAGVIAAGVALSTMVGNAVVDYFARLCGRRTTLLVWAASIQTVAAIGIGLSPSFPLAVDLPARGDRERWAWSARCGRPTSTRPCPPNSGRRS